MLDHHNKTDFHASDVHIAILYAVLKLKLSLPLSDLRLPLYARKTQTQCPRHQPLAYTP
jgi:hypothetical protein